METLLMGDRLWRATADKGSESGMPVIFDGDSSSIVRGCLSPAPLAVDADLA